MPYCPKCGYEYLPTVRECPECREPLTAEPPAEQQPIQEPLVAVYDAPDEVMQVMVRQVLEEAGIPSVVQPGLVPWYDDIRFSARGYFGQVLVFESRADEARRIIAAYLAEVETGEAEREAVEEETQSEDE